LRILQVCPRVPWPPHDGGRVAMLQLTRFLGDVDVVALNQKKFHVDAAAAAAALAPLRLDTVDIDPSRLLHAAMHMRKLRAPLLVARFYSSAFEQLLRARLRATHYDVIHLEGQFLLPYVPAIREETRAPIALRAQNVEFRIWEQLGARRVMFRTIARSLRTWEIAHLNDCDLLVPISAEDDREFRALGATRPSRVIPCGVDTREPVPSAPVDRHHVYFLGSRLYRPNQEAARWLTDEVWPRVLALEPRAKLTIAGSGTGAEIDDIRTFAAPFRAMLAPLFSGSGMRIKVLEAMSFGKPVIATPLGAGGIDVTRGENILIANDADEFARAVVACMNDDALAERIGNAARALVVERYDARTIAQQLLEFYGAPASRAG
jgi:polysaccharide biosynthesis protein PslH